MTRSSNSGRHSTNRFLLLLSAGPLPYDIRFDFFFISVCLTVRPRNKEDGRRERGWRARVLLCLLSSSSGLITRSLPPSHPPTVFRPSITFHSSCMVLATSSNHWVPRRDKKENGMRPEEGARRRRKEGERKSHDLCVNGVLARKSLWSKMCYTIFFNEKSIV